MDTYDVDTTPSIKINKLILVGNGFDLALGLKTSYSDFILWLIKKYIIEAVHLGIKIAPKQYSKRIGIGNSTLLQKRIVDGYSSNLLFDILLKNEVNLEDIKALKKAEIFFEYCDENIEIKVHNKHCIFSRILSTQELKWIDIEGIYFDIVKDILHNKSNLNYIEILNSEMNELKKYLSEYLSKIPINIEKKKAVQYWEQFNDKQETKEFSHLKSDDFNIDFDPPHLYFLNFNYTDTINILNSHFSSSFHFSLNHIHGDLGRDKEKIIFGFGDEMDEVYKKIEELNDNRFFEHIKSF